MMYRKYAQKPIVFEDSNQMSSRSVYSVNDENTIIFSKIILLRLLNGKHVTIYDSIITHSAIVTVTLMVLGQSIKSLNFVCAHEVDLNESIPVCKIYYL